MTPAPFSSVTVEKTQEDGQSRTTGGDAARTASLELLHQVRQGAARLQELTSTLSAVGAAPDRSSALRALLRGAVGVLGGTSGMVALFENADGAGLRLRLRPGGEFSEEPMGPPPVPDSHQWRLLRGAAPILVQDAARLADEGYPLVEALAAGGIRSVVVVPIEIPGTPGTAPRRSGSLHVYGGRPGCFSDGDLAVAAALASQAAAAVERARLYEIERESARRLEAALADLSAREQTIRRQAEHLRLLNEFARTVGSTLDLQEILDTIASQVLGLIGCVRCAIVQYDAPAGVFRLVAARRRPGEPALEESAFVAAEPLAGVPARTRAPFVVPDTSRAEAEVVRRFAEAGTRALVCVPILTGNTLWGTLVAGFDESGAASSERIEYLTGIASHLAVAVNNAELYAGMRAAHDELKATQQHVIRQERLRALGEMASGIAHDFNNALAPIVGFAELLLMFPANLDNRAKAEQFLELIRTSAQDAANVVTRLRQFYRQREPGDQLASVQLANLVREVVSLTQPRWKDQAQAEGRTIDVVVDVDDVPPVAGTEAELREALTNLLFNAVDAMPEGGTITLRVARRDPHVTLEVRDTGIGMSDAVRERCLDPFFTTKGETGTGLGLSIVHGIVRRHEGLLDIDTAPGAGTAIRLRLPVDTAQRRAKREAQVTLPSRPLRVLAVDDEPLVRAVVSEFLLADGHTVEVASNGREALEKFRQGTFDLVLTDRAMPQMSGDQLALGVKQIAPSTPVILLTGYGDLMAATGERPPGIDLVLSKPVRLPQLRSALATALAAV